MTILDKFSHETLLAMSLAGSAVVAGAVILLRRLVRRRRRSKWRMQLQQVHDALSQMESASRRIADQTRDSMAQLESLLAQADRKIAQLRNLCGDGGEYVSQAGPTELQPDVCRLKALGMDNPAIAQKLGIDAGEVELILRLDRLKAVKK
jgi:predicted secreted protein